MKHDPEILAARPFESLDRQSEAVVWHADPMGRIVQAWRWDLLTSQSGTEYRGEGWLEALHPDDRRRTEVLWQEACLTGKLTPLEYRVRQRDGSYRWVLAKAVAVRDDRGAVIEWIGTVTDIHDLHGDGRFSHNNAEMLRLAVEATGIGVWQLDLATRKTDWSVELKRIAGLRADAVIDDQLFYGLVHGDDRDRVEAKITAAVDHGDLSPYEVEYRLFRADTGEMRWLHEWGRLVAGKLGQGNWIVGAIQDITERHLQDTQRRINEERWRLALRAGHMVAWNADVATGQLMETDNATEVLGRRHATLAEFISHVHPDDLERVSAMSRLEDDQTAVIEFRYLRPDGVELWMETRARQISSESGPLVVGIGSDITEKKAAQASLVHAATHDSLTGLPNRAMLRIALDRAVREAGDGAGAAAILLIDIDQFKDVNDTLGHDTGDHLLQVMAERLRRSVGAADFVARLGGDEFAVILGDGPSAAEAEAAARSLIETLAEPFDHNGSRLSIRSTVGIAMTPLHAVEPSELLKDADLALYAAKAGGRFRAALYDPALREAMVRRLNLLAEIRQGLDSDELRPFYQPKVDLKTGAVVGFEALARWLDPRRGVLGPVHFSDVFDDPELALRVDELILRHAVRDMAGWIAAGLEPGKMAVNFSGHAIRNPDMVGWVRQILAGHGLPPARLEIEIPETVFMGGQTEEIGAVLRLLHEFGVSIALDDFGTGFASLTHLKRFPVDVIKIDQSFVRDLEEDADDAAIASAVIGLGRALGIEVVAEGVDRDGQARTLAQWGCPIGQGYLFAEPMDAAAVPGFLRRPNIRGFGVAAEAAK